MSAGGPGGRNTAAVGEARDSNGEGVDHPGWAREGEGGIQGTGDLDRMVVRCGCGDCGDVCCWGSKGGVGSGEWGGEKELWGRRGWWKC